MKKRLIIGLVVGATVFAAVFAAAASLGVTSDDLAAGDSVVAACQPDGADVNVSYSTSYTTTPTAGYKVGTVTISDIDDACNGQAIQVTLTGAANAELDTQTGTVAVDSTAGTPDTSDDFDFSISDILAEDVTGVHVVIAE